MSGKLENAIHFSSINSDYLPEWSHEAGKVLFITCTNFGITIPVGSKIKLIFENIGYAYSNDITNRYNGKIFSIIDVCGKNIILGKGTGERFGYIVNGIGSISYMSKPYLSDSSFLTN